MDLSAILKAFKLPKEVYFLFSVVSGILLFSSTEFLEKLSLVKFKENYNLWIGIVFLLSLGMSIICIGKLLIHQILAWKTRRAESKAKRQTELDEQKRKQKEEIEEKKIEEEHRRKQEKILQYLDNYEKTVLREFSILERNTIDMSLDDPTVLGLVKKKVIRQVSDKAYHTSITGLIGRFRADDITIEYFDSFDFPELNQYPRPKWVDGLEALDALNSKVADLGKQMGRLGRM